MGQQGYAFISGIGGLNDQVNLYYRDSAHANAIISYESDTAPTNITALLDLLNRRGSQGWAYKGDLAMGVNDARSVFVKDSTRASTYAYNAPVGTTLDWAGLLTQLNERGSAGERFIGPVTYGASANAPVYNLYMRAAAWPVTYSYSSAGQPANGTSADAFQTMLAAHGQNRRVLLGAYVPGGNPMTPALLFETSSAQTSTLDYQVIPTPASESTASQVQRHNAKAQEGYVHLGDYAINAAAIGPAAFMSIYVKGLQFPLRQPLAGIVYP